MASSSSSSRHIDERFINDANPFNMQDPSSGVPLRPAIPNEIALKILSFLPLKEAHQIMTLNKNQMFLERIACHSMILANKTSLTLKELRHYQRVLSLDISIPTWDMDHRSYWTKTMKRPLAQLARDGKINLQNLKKLDLSQSSSLKDEELIEIVKLCPNLTSINLAGSNEITDKSIKILAKSCPNLTSANFFDCDKITGDSVLDLAKGCPKLTELNFANCYQIGDAGIKALAVNCPHLASLDLTWINDISDDAFIALSKCPITSLNLTRHVITNERLQLLATLFPNLTSIDLSSPCRGSDFSGESLKAFVLEHPQLRTISLLDQRNLANLEALVLGVNLESIHLTLSENITCAYFNGLAERYPDFHAKIKNLDFGNRVYSQNDDLTDDHLLNILRRCPNLFSLSLEGCKNIKMVDEGFQTLPQLKNLTSIDLNGCGANIDAAVETLLKSCPNLTSINLSNCYYITDATLQSLVRHCPKLASINLFHCPRITDAGLQILATGCPELALISFVQDRDYRYSVTAKGFKALRTNFPHLKILGW